MSSKKYHHGNLRSELLEQAKTELENCGIEKLSLRKVAKRAAVSHTAFAHHFGDARGLLTALTASGFEEFGEALESSRAKALDAQDDPMIASGLAYVEFAMEQPQLFTLMFASGQPDFEDPKLDAASMAAFSNFILDVGKNEEPKAPSTGKNVNIVAMSNWAKVHGIAILLMTGRMRSVLSLSNIDRKKAIIDILTHN